MSNMWVAEYIIDEYGNLITKSGISLESQFLTVNVINDDEDKEKDKSE